ncbi:IS4 family transposase [Bradyrhizobium sp.]|uniref:IS4 family transposase n=1 Tax=Bradyrhizobium sp. TaxID=376 RepID=UPI0026210AFD|nr:IS4 family transposase [Bradyrhizobium sp.]
MRFTSSIFAKLLEPLNRRQFDGIVARHRGNAYDKSFESWDHLLVLMFGQFSKAETLRGVEASWNANRQHHYHLASGTVQRSTLSDANRRRPVEVFSDTFILLAGQLDRLARRDGRAMLRLIDSTPIPLGKLYGWAKSNGRFKGMKVHIVYAPETDSPRILGITNANVNDAPVGRTATIEAGATYVFDKGYCHYGWWRQIADAKAFFVTRPKSSMKLELVEQRPLLTVTGDGFTVLDDAEVSFASKGDSKLPIRLRQIKVQRHETGDVLTLLTNDLARPALEIAALYKARWQIELLFRWIKQHLKIRKFLGNNDNAIRLQIYAAMIAYALLRIAVRTYKIHLSILRFTDLVAQCLFDRRDIAAIDRPPPVNPSTRKTRSSPHQLRFTYV